MTHPPSLRLDVRRPTPWRKAPILLFGDRRRRWREWALAGGATTLGVAATLCLAVGLIHDGKLTGDPTVVAAAGPPPRASDFPLIETRPTRHTPPLPRPDLRPPAPPAASSAAAPPAANAPESAAREGGAAAPDIPAPGRTALPAPPSPPPTHEAAAPTPVAPAPPVAPPPTAVPPAVGPAAPAPPAPPPHYLQVGTYRQRPNAVADQAHFAAQGIETVILRRGDYYVLRLPPFASRQAAEAEEARLRGLGVDCLYIGPPR